jgi:hypothetical protein
LAPTPICVILRTLGSGNCSAEITLVSIGERPAGPKDQPGQIRCADEKNFVVFNFFLVWIHLLSQGRRRS